MDFLCIFPLCGSQIIKKLMLCDRPMSNLVAAIGIPCYFRAKSEGSHFGQNNMGSLWQPLDWTWFGFHNIQFLIA